mmetsp:Transcript_95535/g.169638  ORF Transcript_95535/g.169638 Transcript_95535/m.169638 type:complete len:227 (+) Transcript_95535:694-1374(+)
MRWKTASVTFFRRLSVIGPSFGSSFAYAFANSAAKNVFTNSPTCLPPCPSKMAKRAKFRSGLNVGTRSRRDAQMIVSSSICRRIPFSPYVAALTPHQATSASVMFSAAMAVAARLASGASSATCSSSASSALRFSIPGWTPIGRYWPWYCGSVMIVAPSSTLCERRVLSAWRVLPLKINLKQSMLFFSEIFFFRLSMSSSGFKSISMSSLRDFDSGGRRKTFMARS